jgi:hypothetical protein
VFFDSHATPRLKCQRCHDRSGTLVAGGHHHSKHIVKHSKVSKVAPASIVLNLGPCEKLSTLVGSMQISSLIPAHIYSPRPWSFHCPHVGWGSGSTFDHWRSRSQRIPIQGHGIWPWVLLCTLLARVRDIETVFAVNRPLGGDGRRGIWCPKGAYQIPGVRDMFLSPLPRS